MHLVFLHGPPASGKLTIARELGAITGFRVFHNHITVDALLSVFEFGSPPFIELRERIWLDVMAEAANTGLAGLVFTFAPERTVRTNFVPNLMARLGRAAVTTHFIKLHCPAAEIEKRLGDPSRRDSQKLRSVDLYRSLLDAGAFEYPPLPADLTIDTSEFEPRESARFIVDHCRLSEKTGAANPANG
jgi:hypothetical protein